MRYASAALLLLVASCTSATVTASAPPTSTSGPQDSEVATAADRACVTSTVDQLFTAINASDTKQLDRILGASAFSLSGRPTTGPSETTALLAERAAAGERWSLVSLQVSGRSWSGNVGFGLRLRRSGPGLPQPYADQAAKGEMDCPSGRIWLLYVG